MAALVLAFLGGMSALSVMRRWSEHVSLVARRGFSVVLQGRQRRRAEESVGPALRLFADSLDAGLTIPAAAARVGEGTDPAARSLSGFSRDCSRGMTVAEGLSRLTAGTNGDLWASAAFTIELHFRQGGDLASAIRRVAEELESRRQSRNAAAAATSQARFTANLVCAMPLLAMAAATVVFPGRVEAALTNPASVMLMSLGLVLQVGSLLAIRRITCEA